jgi:peptidoglycan/LPS O-acetylase OafA/YrhL
VAKLPALTSLRFVAALLVVVWHARGSFGFAPSYLGRLPATFADHFLLTGMVSFFFLLSGFILTYVHPSLDAIGRRQFIVARLARLYPAHLAAFAMWIVLLPDVVFSRENTPGMFVAFLALVHTWLPIQKYGSAFNWPAWSLSTELAFYGFFLWAIPSWRRTWPFKLGLAALLLVGVIALANRFDPPLPMNGDGLSLVALVYDHPFSRLLEFAVGMVTALVWRAVAPRFPSRVSLATLIEIAALLVTVAAMYFALPIAMSPSIQALGGPAARMWFAFAGITLLPFAALIVTMAVGRGHVSRFLAAPMCVLLGEISYAVYLVHGALLRVYAAHAARLERWFPGWVCFLAYVTVTLLASYLTWALTERARRLLVAAGTPWAMRGRASDAAAETHAKPTPTPTPTAERATQRASARVGLTTLPTRRQIAGVVLALALVVGALATFAVLPPPLKKVDPATLREATTAGVPDAEDVDFGDWLRLRAARIVRVADGVRLDLVWESRQPRSLDWFVAVHCIDGSGAIISQADYPQDEGKSMPAAGTIWIDEVHLQERHLPPSVTAVVIAVYRLTGERLAVSRGERQWAEGRLILPLVPP